MPETSGTAFDQARQMAVTIIGGQPESEIDLDRAVEGALAAAAVVHPDTEIDPDALRRALEELVTVFVDQGTQLTDESDHEPWLLDARGSIQWRFWERYESFLGLPPAAKTRLNELTDEILAQLESPTRDGYWDRRGMVAGQVQSGKTSNYTGLICKAADAGYKVIVVLAGLHDSLRSQTQHRIDEGFLGFDSRAALTFDDGGGNRRIGAGAMIASSKLLPVFSYTSALPKGDFNTAVASRIAGQVGSDPVVLVVKKNKTILENLISWTRTGAVTDPTTGRRVVFDQPLLVIDDEADNASVNTKDVERETDEFGEVIAESDPTTINRLIRQLLHGFQKSAYVGYTATPFANIFIWEDHEHSRYGEDLFPRSFIVRMPPPSNHVGPARVFGVTAAGEDPDEPVEELPIIRRLDDYEDFLPDRHRKDVDVGPLPDSLREALRAFVLSCAVRRARGQEGVHNSMLVHVTRFVSVQEQVHELVRDGLDSMRMRIRSGEGQRTRTLREQLKELWERDYRPTTAKFEPGDRGEIVQWDAVDAELGEAISRITTMRINGTSADALAYADHPDGLNVVAIGGDKLSRGLTLEGLTVSYYLRTSRMYDTLMQMGRWFGYRPGYLDVCRLYTTAELVDWYRDITVANEELMEEFDAMAAAGGTPRDYGLRVKKHPAGLMITARAKMRNGTEMRLDLSGSAVPTNVFSLDPAPHHDNLKRVEAFLSEQTDAGRNGDRGVRNSHVWREVPGRDVGAMLADLRVSPRAHRANGRILARYIDAAVANQELLEWTVAVVTKKDAESPEGPRIAGQPVGLIERRPQRVAGELRDTTHYTIRQILSGPDEWIDLSEDELKLAREITRRRHEEGEIQTKSGKPPELDGLSARLARPSRRGLLLLYPLDPDPPREELGMDVDIPIIGFYASFPKSERDTSVAYQVNNVYFQAELL